MKFFTKSVLALCVVSLLILSGCAMTGEKDTALCGKPEAENSLICKYIPSPYGADFGLMFVNLEAIKEGLYTKEQAENFLTDIETYLETEQLTYQLLVNFLKKKVDIANSFAIELIFLSQFLEMPEFHVDLILDPFDKYLLKAHIANQRNKVLALF